MKKIIAMLLALVMVFALVACGNADKPVESEKPGESQQPEKPAESEKPAEPVMPEFDGEIVVGHLADLTGFEALTGIEAQVAIDFAVKQINLAGGIAGKELVVKHGDSQCSAPMAVEQAKKLVMEDKVLCILGPTQASHKAAVGDALAELGVAGIYYNGTSFNMTKFKKQIIGVGGSMYEMPTVMADYVYNTKGWKTIYVMGIDNQGGKGYGQPFVGTYEALGGKIVSVDWIAEGADMAPYFSTKSGKEADGIVAWFSGSESQKFWINWYDSGLNEALPVVAYQHGGFTDHFILSGLEESGREDVVEAILECAEAPITYHYGIDTPENKAFVEAWKAEFGSVPGATNLPGAAYAAVLALKTAYESIDGEVTAANLYEALSKIEINTPEGHLTFDEGSRAANKDVYIVKVVRDGDSFTYEGIATYKDVPAATGYYVEGAVLELD